MSEDVADVAPASERMWIAAVEMDGLPGLGGPVRLEMTPRCTVLVGWNGVGKSLLLHGVARACAEATNPLPSPSEIPRRFFCEIHRGDQPCLQYEFVKSERQAFVVDFRTMTQHRPFELDERCWIVDAAGKRQLWEKKEGVVPLPDGKQIPLSVGRLQVGEHWPGLPLGVEERTLIRSLRTVMVFAGVPREGFVGRTEVLLRTSSAPHREIDPHDVGHHSFRLSALAWSIVRLNALDAELFAHLQEMGRRVSVLRELEVVFRSFPRKEKDDFPDLAAVLVDGQNLGLHSDGTLRVLETLVALLSDPGTLLLLEEPETGIHPGLLEGLLHEIEAYASGSQLLISTHSMQVVSWARPDEIRLVERVDDHTTVRALRPSELEHLSNYLTHQGTLGEYVFQGGLDE
jgi:predicted ATPase